MFFRYICIKSHTMIKTFLAAMLLLPVLSSAQSKGFRYDTIPASQIPSTNSFHYETGTPKAAQAQSEKRQTAKKQSGGQGFDPHKLVFGGSLGLGFSNGYTAINVSPQVGYAFNRYFTAGGGIAYNYYRDSNFQTYTQNYMGGNLYARITPIPLIHIQVQPELYGMWGRSGSQKIDPRAVPACLVGGGISIPAGRRAGIAAMIYYDLVQDDWSPYNDELIYSIGFTYGF